MDYMKYKQGIKYPFTIELGPSPTNLKGTEYSRGNLFQFNKKYATQNADNMITLIEVKYIFPYMIGELLKLYVNFKNV